MPQSHLKFHSTNGKRLVLVVDDELINREILSHILSTEYEVLSADNGSEALSIMQEYRETLSLVLLDLNMPVMSGYDVLKTAKADAQISHLPIIVITSDQSAEIESLHLGAVDFIPKPYPDAGVILARVQRTIEFNEDRETIASTERDPLTGLYNKEFFFLYAEQYDQFHNDQEMDAIVLDVNHFRLINERYGKAYGDEVLCRIGKKVREIVQDSGGIVSRRESDTFMVYCPHRDDYKAILENASIGLAGEESADNRVRLRLGVYSNVDKGIEIERRFDRAKMAANTVKGSFTNPIGIYDENMHNREIYAEQLIEDFPAAVAQKQFQVYYQPKFDVRPATPVLASAEALVRWNHPEHGMISPGFFIPLFEENGLIEQLDLYVWKEAASQIRRWKEAFGFYVPISVNVSRIDLYDPNIYSTLQNILSENGLSASDLMLEVTESAYTQDSAQIIETVSKLRDLGFRIEMDDFGTGYSSLNMLSTLPIDALKLDMQFVRTAFKEGGNTHMVEIIIQIAALLSVPVIAEGVETEEQLNTLRHLGCDLIQGYFFSKPVPAKEFEAFILQKKETIKHAASKTERLSVTDDDDKINQKQPENNKTSEGVQENACDENAERKSIFPSLHLRTANIFFSVIAVLAAIALFISDIAVTRGYRRMEQASDRYISAQLAASDMESGSDYLTDRVRCFVVTGELQYLEDFFEEVETTRRRDQAVNNLEKLIGTDNAALSSLNTALELSNHLVDTEYHAMRLALEAEDYDLSLLPEAITSIQLSEDELALSKAQLHEKAEGMVFDNIYMHYKDRIRENVSQCTQALILTSSQELENASAKMSLLVRIQTIVTVVFLLIIVGFVAVIRWQVLKPLTHMVEKMKDQETMEPVGAEELRFVAQTYNDFIQNKFFRDPLTGLNNRRSFDVLMQNVDTDHMAYLVIDVDNFKTINDKYGHSMGDRVLRRVAEVLKNSFRSVDIICRFGGDEFIVVMTRSNSTMQQLVRSKISRANDILMHPKDDLPPVSLSVGVAFSDRKNPQNNIFDDADAALYRVKEGGRKGCAIFGEEVIS